MIFYFTYRLLPGPTHRWRMIAVLPNWDGVWWELRADQAKVHLEVLTSSWSELEFFQLELARPCLHCRLHNEIAKIAFVHVDSDLNMSRRTASYSIRSGSVRIWQFPDRMHTQFWLLCRRHCKNFFSLALPRPTCLHQLRLWYHIENILFLILSHGSFEGESQSFPNVVSNLDGHCAHEKSLVCVYLRLSGIVAGQLRFFRVRTDPQLDTARIFPSISSPWTSFVCWFEFQAELICRWFCERGHGPWWGLVTASDQDKLAVPCFSPTGVVSVYIPTLGVGTDVLFEGRNIKEIFGIATLRHDQDCPLRSGGLEGYSSTFKMCQFWPFIEKEAVIRGIVLSIRPFNWCTDEKAIRAEFQVSVDIARLELRERRKACRNTLLIYIMVCRQVNVEEEVETSRCHENAYIPNSNASTSIGVGKRTAGPGGPYRYPAACLCQALKVDSKASRNRRAWKE